MTAPITASGGGICPLCRWAQDNGHPHPCITNPNAQSILLTLIAAGRIVPRDFAPLADHPARPYIEGQPLRPVHRTWCFCACSPTPSTAPPGAARS